MRNQLSILLLASLIPSTLAVTTIQAFLAPSGAAASVIASAPEATTYSIVCTKGCAANQANNQATLVNGPSSAAFTNIADSRTLIVDCKMLGGGKGDCTSKAISGAETRTVKETLTFKEQPVVITAGLEKLGYVVVETTLEVNTTVTIKSSKAASSTNTVTLTSLGSATTAKSSSPSRTSASTPTPTITSSDGVLQERPNSAPSVRLHSGLAIVGLAGVLLAAL